MSKTLIAIAAASVASVCLVAGSLYTTGGGSVPPMVAGAAAVLMLPGVVGIVYVLFAELSAERKYRRMREEGRRYAAKSDAEFKLRKQDPKHIEELERALAA